MDFLLCRVLGIFISVHNFRECRRVSCIPALSLLTRCSASEVVPGFRPGTFPAPPARDSYQYRDDDDNHDPHSDLFLGRPRDGLVFRCDGSGNTVDRCDEALERLSIDGDIGGGAHALLLCRYTRLAGLLGPPP